MHEIFKCLEETDPTNAFIAELKDGSIKGFNCKIKISGNIIEVTPTEGVVSRVHVSLKRNAKVIIDFAKKVVMGEVKSGEMVWIYQDVMK